MSERYKKGRAIFCVNFGWMEKRGLLRLDSSESEGIVGGNLPAWVEITRATDSLDHPFTQKRTPPFVQNARVLFVVCCYHPTFPKIYILQLISAGARERAARDYGKRRVSPYARKRHYFEDSS